MGQATGSASFVRCLLVLLTVTAGATVLLSFVVPDLLALGNEVRSGAPFDVVLVGVCEAAVAACAAWLWLATAVVATEAARGLRPGHRGVPDSVRRAVLVACGVALAGGLAAPAHAEETGRRPDRTETTPVEGLPLPDRATTAHVSLVFARAAAHQAPAGSSARPDPTVVVVRPGDTLWDLARASLPPRADNDTIADRVREIHLANRAVIGADPDVIRPNQRLLMPATIREEHP